MPAVARRHGRAGRHELAENPRRSPNAITIARLYAVVVTIATRPSPITSVFRNSPVPVGRSEVVGSRPWRCNVAGAATPRVATAVRAVGSVSARSRSRPSRAARTLRAHPHNGRARARAGRDHSRRPSRSRRGASATCRWREPHLVSCGGPCRRVADREVRYHRRPGRVARERESSSPPASPVPASTVYFAHPRPWSRTRT